MLTLFSMVGMSALRPSPFKQKIVNCRCEEHLSLAVCGIDHALSPGFFTPMPEKYDTCTNIGGARWLSGRVSDSRARGRGFETYRRRVVSLSKTLYSPKVLVNYPGIGGSVPT